MVVMFNPPHLLKGQALGTSFLHLMTHSPTQTTPSWGFMIGRGWQPIYSLAKTHNNEKLMGPSDSFSWESELGNGEHEAIGSGRLERMEGS